MKLTHTNYHSAEANKAYWSVSQFKAFQSCQASAMAELNGEYERPVSEALLQGSYVDAHFSGELAEFLETHPEILNKRSGELKAAYVKSRAAIERAEQDPMFIRYVNGGDVQKIMTGELFGVEWKVKIDCLHDDKIVDLKYMRDMGSVYKGGEWKPFVMAYGYDLQGYIYQQVVEQNTGKHLPFYLAVITKEDPADIQLIHISDKFLNVNKCLVEHYLPIFDAIKQGKEDPERCEACAYCRGTKTLTGAIELEDLMEDE